MMQYKYVFKKRKIHIKVIPVCLRVFFAYSDNYQDIIMNYSILSMIIISCLGTWKCFQMTAINGDSVCQDIGA